MAQETHGETRKTELHLLIAIDCVYSVSVFAGGGCRGEIQSERARLCKRMFMNVSLVDVSLCVARVPLPVCVSKHGCG